MEKKNQVALIRRGEMALARRMEPKEEYITAVADIFETPNAFVVKLDMPGSTKDGISVNVESNILTVLGAVKSHHRENSTLLIKEIVALSYFRAFKLGDGLAAGRIEAEFENGVLTVLIPKTEDYKRREIPIT